MRVGLRHYEVVDGRPRTVAPVQGPEVGLTVDGRTVTDADLTPSDVQHSPARLAWTLSGPGLTVRMTVEADGAVVRKRATVSGRGRLTRIELDRWPDLTCEGFETTGEPVAYNEGPVGLGQPVFGLGFFAGIEHPVSENLVGDGTTLALPVHVDLGDEPWTSPAAVLGPGGLEEFWDSVDALRPNPPRLVTLTNNWYHLGATGLMDEASVRAEVDGFAEVSARHGLDLRFVVLDDGWEGDYDPATGLWGRMAPARFPSGTAPLGASTPLKGPLGPSTPLKGPLGASTPLKGPLGASTPLEGPLGASTPLDEPLGPSTPLKGPLGPRIGLWLSPFGGYGDRAAARRAWAIEHGFEVHPEYGLCQAGAAYRAHLEDVLTRWTEAGVAYWKLDGVRFDCPDPGHGHPVGPGARTAQVESFRGLVEAIRSVRPDAVVIFTIGSHPSPWWLSTVDFVWRGGLDDTASDHPGTRLDRFDTYIDTCLQRYRAAAFPVSALVPFAFVEAPNASYRDADTTPEVWARHCWLAAGRGTLHHDLYLAPDSLSDEQWATLAEALAWARDHEGALARSRMVLGDPGAGEVYGFATPATLCLRNPSAEPRTVECHPQLTARHGPAPSPDGTITLGPLEVAVLTRRR